jgi:hypothetical protein
MNLIQVKRAILLFASLLVTSSLNAAPLTWNFIGTTVSGSTYNGTPIEEGTPFKAQIFLDTNLPGFTVDEGCPETTCFDGPTGPFPGQVVFNPCSPDEFSVEMNTTDMVAYLESPPGEVGSAVFFPSNQEPTGEEFADFSFSISTDLSHLRPIPETPIASTKLDPMEFVGPNDLHVFGNMDTFSATTVSNAPPVITGISVDQPVLWPPNHRLENVTVSYEVSDECPLPPNSCTLSVTTNEPINGTGGGNTSPDWIILDAHHVQLRAERAGNGNGRIYTITITCTDSAGNSSSRSVTVSVPHDRGRH